MSKANFLPSTASHIAIPDAEGLQRLTQVRPNAKPGITTDMDVSIGRIGLTSEANVPSLHIQPTDGEINGDIL